MNKVIMVGRLTADPEIRTSGQGTKIANYRLAVDRRFKREGQPEADFFRCITFGKGADFVEKYLHKGTKMVVEGRLQNSSYEKDGVKHYNTDLIVENQEFAESKRTADANASAASAAPASADDAGGDEFMNIPDDIAEELPFQ